MIVSENLKSGKLLRRIKAGILSAVMFTGSVMANYTGLVGKPMLSVVGEEETAAAGESSKTLAEIDKYLGCDITLKPNGQWKVTFKAKKAGEIIDTIPANVMNASDFDDYRDNIDEIVLPGSVTTIEAHAFEGMESLHSVRGCSSIKTVGEAAFKNCTYLTWCQAVSPAPGTDTVYSNLQTIGDEAFSNSGLTEIKMPSVLTTIGNKAFYGCNNLTKVDFTPGCQVNSFGAKAFTDCKALKEINLENCTADKIVFKKSENDNGTGVFSGCTALEEVTIPAGAFDDLSYLFSGATSLKSITFIENNNNVSVGHIVGSTSVEVLDFTNLKGLSSIGSWCFQNDDLITEIIIPGNVTEIAQWSMSEMDSLGTVKFLENEKITNIGVNAFQNDTSLSSINLEALTNLNTINQCAFDGCSALTSITIPGSVTEIKDSAFGHCVGLVDLKYNATNLTNVGNSIFAGAGVFDLTIGENVEKIPADFLRQAQEHISDIKFDGTPTFTITGEGDLNAPFEVGGTYTADKAGNLYKIGENGAILVRANKAEETIEIPESVNGHIVTGIATDAFKNANVTSLTFDNIGQITTLEDYAFANAALLEKINDIGTIEDVKGLFTGITEEPIKDNVFYNTKIGTGIEDKTKEEVFPPEDVVTPGKASPESHDTAIKIWRPSGESNVMSLNYNIGNHGDEIKEEKDAERKGKFWTGQVANVNFSYMGGRPVRIYIKADDDAEIKLNGRGDIPGVTEDGIYYYDIIYNGSGTGTDALNLSYPNFTSPGSKMQVWAVEFDTEEHFNDYFSGDKEKAVIYPGQTLDDETIKVSDKYFELEWTTKPDNFDLEKNWVSNDDVNFIKSDDKITVSNLKWQIIFTDENPKADEINLGSDLVRYVDYTDEITLPTELNWREGIDTSLDNTRFIKKGDSSTLYIRIDDKDYELFTLSNFANLVSMSVEKSGDNYLLHWRVINPNTDAEIAPVNNGYITFGPEVIVADGITAGGSIENITNKVHTDEYFTFSDVQKDDNEASTGGFNAPAGKINIKKERLNDITRMGEDVQYKITVENPSAFDYTGMTKIVDDLNADGYNAHYIKPENMQALFDDVESEDKKGDRLTITISNAVLANKLGSTDANTVANTGTNISEQDTAADNQKYDGLAEPDASVAYRDVTITLHKNGENIEINYTGKSTEETPTEINKTITIGAGKTIADALSEIGYIVTESDSYQLEWDYKNYKLEGGEKLEFTLNTTIKDSLMYLPEKDHDYYYNWTDGITLNLFNSVTMNGSDKVLTADTSNPMAQARQDLEIKKNALVNGKEMKFDDLDPEKNYNPSDGDIIDYFVNVIHHGTDNYEVLPVVDHMTGMQAVIVEAEWNKNPTWKDKAKTTTIDGTEYYVLNKPDTIYNGVYTSKYFYADSIVVTDAEGGLDTLIKYYIEDTPGRDFTLRVPYKAILSQEFTGDENTKLDYKFGNEAWLNDRPGHRIHDTIGGKGLAVAFDKDILIGDRIPDDPNKEELAKSSSLESDKNKVTYRLKLTNKSSARFKEDSVDHNVKDIISIGDSLEIKGSDIFDMLPLTGNAFDWKEETNISQITYSRGTPGYGGTKDNFNHETYGKFEFNGSELNGESSGTEWKITKESPSTVIKSDNTDQQYIKWENDFKITLPPAATVYMYVTLTFAEGDQWSQFLSEKSSEILVNKFYFCDMPASVSHNLSGTPVVLLQKGVYETGSYVVSHFYNGNPELSGQYIRGQDRFHYSNTSEKGNLKNTVTYYVVLRNSGDTNLYLAPIYDILPPGFEYMALRTGDGSYVGNSWYHVGNSDTDKTHAYTKAPTQNYGTGTIMAKPVDDNFSDWDSDFIKTYVKYSYADDTEKHETANGCQILKFEFENNDADYHNELKHDDNGYYLKPGQYLQFGYTVYTGNNPITEAVNTVAMQYYDPFNTGVDAELDTATPVKVKDINKTSPNNDGSRELWTNKKANDFGFTETLPDGNSDHKWLVSDVTVTREKISPGIKKLVKSPMIEAGKGADWTVTSFNNSNSEISGYTITDTLDLPLQFEGKFTYSLYNKEKEWYIRAGDKKDVEEGQENNYLFDITRNADGTIKVTSNTGDEKTFNLGDKAVTLSVRTVCYVTWDGNPTSDTEITVKLVHDEKNHEVLTIGFEDARWSIVPNGYSVLEFSTSSPEYDKDKPTDIAGQYTNTAMFSPYDKNYDDTITQGKLVENDDGTNLGVEHSAVVSIYTGSPSGSVKMIEQKDKTDNFTTSEREDNYIKLPDAKTPFTYTLEVRNVNDTGVMDNLVIIDNLPEQDDATTLRKESLRESEFKVSLAEESGKIEPNIEVWLYNSGALKADDVDLTKSPVGYTNKGTKLSAGTGGDYTVEYSDKSSNFDENDWEGKNTTDGGGNRWYSSPTENTRSIRIHFNSDKKIAPNQAIQIRFDAQIDGSDENAQPGKIAWNTFGYSYKVNGLTAKASPNKVGICIPGSPTLTKKVVDFSGKESKVPEKTTFKFIIYKNNNPLKFDDYTEKTVAKTLNDAKIDFMYKELTVDVGEFESKAIPLEKFIKYDYKGDEDFSKFDEPKDKTGDFWDENSNYYVVELAINDKFSYQSTNGNAVNNYRFKVDPIRNTPLTFVNENLCAPVELPETGGNGTVGFVFGGLMTFCLSAFFLWRKKQKHTQK